MQAWLSSLLVLAKIYRGNMYSDAMLLNTRRTLNTILHCSMQMRKEKVKVRNSQITIILR